LNNSSVKKAGHRQALKMLISTCSIWGNMVRNFKDSPLRVDGNAFMGRLYREQYWKWLVCGAKKAKVIVLQVMRFFFAVFAQHQRPREHLLMKRNEAFVIIQLFQKFTLPEGSGTLSF